MKVANISSFWMYEASNIIAQTSSVNTPLNLGRPFVFRMYYPNWFPPALVAHQ